MTYTFIADFRKLDINISLKEQENLKEMGVGVCEYGKNGVIRLSDEVMERILSTKSERLKRERMAAYLLAAEATKKIIGIDPDFIWIENNKKPCLKDSPYNISISHSSDIVAFSIRDELHIGVDVEAGVLPEKAKRLEKRYFSEIDFNYMRLNVSYFFSEFSENSTLTFGKITDINSRVSDDIFLFKANYSEDFTCKWCLYEAAIKCGKGFCFNKSQNKTLLLSIRSDVKKIKVKDNIFYIATVSE
ncbi:MAG: hypothetical protein IJX92_07065 [Clostridia bacterium]|nr:hypothetical protein [Clostridia bacterium]